MNTKELLKILKQINSINKEIKDLNERINNIPFDEVGDSVQKSSSNFPFTKTTLKIQGYAENKKRKKYKDILNENKSMLLDLLIELEKELKKIDDSQIRLIIRYRYVDKKSWTKIGKDLHITGDSARMELKRFFQGK